MMYVLLEEAPEAGVTVDAVELNEDCEVRPAGGGAACCAGPPKREAVAGVDGYAIARVGVGGRGVGELGSGREQGWDVDLGGSFHSRLDAFTDAPS